MAIKFGRKKQRKHNVLYTFVTAILICVVFLSLVASFYQEAENEAYEMLHIQTKQIKDDLTLQIKSDRENLVTMAHFAAKLYADGESYDLLFASFEPIGLFSNIGILNPDNTFVTKAGTLDLSEKISFTEEAARGAYISGRVPDLTREGKEIVRSAVPIISDGETVGMLYGVIHLHNLAAKYNNMAKELDAQLFVYDKASGKFVIDTINRTPGELEQFKNREYKDGYSYDAFVNTESGYSSFKSIFTDEDLYIHYSTLEDFHWGIILARYESQVFAKANAISKLLFVSFALMILIIVVYLLFVVNDERRRSRVTVYASTIRKLLLELNQQQKNVLEALKKIQDLSSSRSAFLVDTEDEDYHYIANAFKDHLLIEDDRKYFVGELFRYAASLQNINHSTVGFMHISPGRHLANTNKRFYEFLKAHQIHKISFASVIGHNNHVSLLGTINAKRNYVARELLEDVAVCFSIAIYNKKHLNRTETAATTDSLTGALNRVSFNRDILVFDEEKPEDFACIYIDVNELHIINNKFGHAAGDEMLIYIANTLKEVFFGHNVYRMGGDEFLVFAQDISQQEIKDNIAVFIEQLQSVNYHVAIGVSYRIQNTNCEEMVREAEVRMYEAKAQYYQNKEQIRAAKDPEHNYIQINTGIREIDAMLSILKEHYNGIYRVALDSDIAHRILMPSYLGYNQSEQHFSKLLMKYIDEFVHPDFHRAVMSFLNYDSIKKQMAEGTTPRVTYQKTNGETVILSVYNLDQASDNTHETLWVFAKA